MKKIISIITMIGLCTTLLAGCGCRHEWAEADCKNDKTCTNCGQTEGEALGHSMENGACIRCDVTEAELFLVGNWVGQAVTVDEFYSLDGTDFSCTFREDGTCTVILIEGTYEGSWKESDIKLNEDTYCYSVSSADAEYGFLFNQIDDNSIVLLRNNYSMLFVKSLTVDDVAGVWYHSPMTLTLSPDGSFTVTFSDGRESTSGTFEVLGNTVRTYYDGNQAKLSVYTWSDGALMLDNTAFEKVSE